MKKKRIDRLERKIRWMWRFIFWYAITLLVIVAINIYLTIL